MSDGQRELVREAVQVNRALAQIISVANPIWPAGLPAWEAPVVAFGLASETSRFVTIWSRSENAQESILRFPDLIGADVTVRTVFPANLTEWTTRWEPHDGILRVLKPTRGAGARVLELVPSRAES
jgi:alpha-galactosidase